MKVQEIDFTFELLSIMEKYVFGYEWNQNFSKITNFTGIPWFLAWLT